jgi:hypothetical protein
MEDNMDSQTIPTAPVTVTNEDGENYNDLYDGKREMPVLSPSSPHWGEFSRAYFRRIEMTIMIDEPLRSSIAALLRLAEGASPLPWDMIQSETDTDIAYIFEAANLAPQLARLVLQLDKNVSEQKLAISTMRMASLLDGILSDAKQSEKREQWQAAADRAAETGLYPLQDEGEIEIKSSGGEFVTVVTLAPDQESRLADAVVARVLRGMKKSDTGPGYDPARDAPNYANPIAWPPKTDSLVLTQEMKDYIDTMVANISNRPSSNVQFARDLDALHTDAAALEAATARAVAAEGRVEELEEKLDPRL